MLKRVLTLLPFSFAFASNANQYVNQYPNAYGNQYANQYAANPYIVSDQYSSPVNQQPIPYQSASGHNSFFISAYSGFDFSAKIQSTINNVVYDDDYKISPLIGGALGYDYKDISLSLSYDRRSFKSTDNSIEYGNKLNIGIALANIAYNFNNISPSFVPYIGIGLGMAMSQIKYYSDVTYLDGVTTSKTQDIDKAFTYQVKGGARLFLTQHIAVFADARFTSIQSSEYTKNQFFDNGSTVRMQFFSVNGGLSLFF